MDIWTRLLDPFGHTTGREMGVAPDSPEGRRRQRIADLRGAPRATESFVDYARRLPSAEVTPTEPVEIAPIAEGFVMYRELMRRQAAQRPSRMVLRPDSRVEAAERVFERQRDAPPTPGQVVGRGAVEEFNRPSMILSDIPMGLARALPRAEPYKTEGREVATGYRTDGRGRPIALRTGTFNWGTDERRPVRDVLRDVSIAAGAPQDMLYMIGRRENYPYLELYDRPPAEGGGVSSARGPHQFTTGTFKQWVNGLGPMYGLPTTMGAQERASLVDDARFSGAMTAEMARYNASILTPRIGQAPSVADLYMMHHGGEEAIPLLEAVHRGRGDAPAAGFYSTAAVRNHMNDYFVNGDRSRPRTARQFYDWMTGQDDTSPHRRDYITPGRLQGLPTEPVEFGERMDGSREPAALIRPGVVGLPADSLLARSMPLPGSGTPNAPAR